MVEVFFVGEQGEGLGSWESVKVGDIFDNEFVLQDINSEPIKFTSTRWRWPPGSERPSQASTEQPAPKANDTEPVWHAVIADMLKRDRVGRARYGVPLQAGNGRDALRDAYEEALDLAVYLKQAIMERDAPPVRTRAPTRIVRAADIAAHDPSEDGSININGRDASGEKMTATSK